MADIVWAENAPASGAFNNGPSWVGGTAPADASGDNAIFDGTADGDCTDTTGAIDLAAGRIITAPDYPGNLGDVGNPLSVNSAGIFLNGSGTVYLECIPDTEGIWVGNGNVTIVNASSGVKLYIAGGRVTLASTCTIGDIHIANRGSGQSNASLTADASATFGHIYGSNAGVHLNASSSNNIIMAGGSLTTGGAAVLSGVVVNCGANISLGASGDVTELVNMTGYAGLSGNAIKAFADIFCHAGSSTDFRGSTANTTNRYEIGPATVHEGTGVASVNKLAIL